MQILAFEFRNRLGPNSSAELYGRDSSGVALVIDFAPPAVSKALLLGNSQELIS